MYAKRCVKVVVRLCSEVGMEPGEEEGVKGLIAQ